MSELVELTKKTLWRNIFLIFNCILIMIGNAGGPMILRLYFIHGGKRLWFNSFLQTAGFPIMLIPLTIAYVHRRRANPDAKLFFMKGRIFLASIIIGVLTGLDNYLFSYGLARIPVSTESLILASMLAFTAVFAYLIVKQKFTAFSINAAVLLCVAAGILGLNTSSDRPSGVTKKMYTLGFIMTLLATCLQGFILPLVELTYLKCKQVMTYTLVLELQLVYCFAATAFSAVGMIINNDFQAISTEASQYGLGETKYYLVSIGTGIIMQCFFLGTVGVIFYASSLLSGIVAAVSLPITQLLAVVIYHEKFQATKGVALFLALWGFGSYFYGEMKNNKKIIDYQDTEGEVHKDTEEEDQLAIV